MVSPKMGAEAAALGCLKHLGTLGQSQIRRHGSNVAEDPVLLLMDRLEEQHPAAEIHVNRHYHPLSRTSFCLAKLKRTAFPDRAQDSAAEPHIFRDYPFEFGKALLAGMDQHRALHSTRKPGSQRSAAKTGVWLKAQLQQLPLLVIHPKQKRIRHHLQQIQPLLDVVLKFAGLLALPRRVMEQLLDAL